MKHSLLFAVLALGAGHVSAQQAENTQSIQQRMSPEQFKAAGLEKLSAAELKALNDWVNGVKTVVVEKVVEKRVEVEKPKEDTSDINSRLVGEFNGWRGNAVFTLENGQVWEQIDASALYASKLTNPKVRLAFSGFSGWKLQVDGYNAWVKVKRVK